MKLDFGWRRHGYYYTYSRCRLATTSSFTECLCVKDGILGSTPFLSLMLKIADVGISKTSLKFFVHRKLETAN